MTMDDRSGRRDGLHEVLGRSPDAGNVGAHRTRWWTLRLAVALAALAVLVTVAPEPVVHAAAPTASDNTVTMNEDTGYAFAAADFNFADTDDDTLSRVRIVTVPSTSKGVLYKSGTAISSPDLPQFVSKAGLDAGDLKYFPAMNANGLAYATFNFKVNDGTEDSASTYTMTIDVRAVNDPATGAPTITGTARVGNTLTAVTTGIMDVDGLTSPAYTYQWIRVDGGTDANISGANSSTYTMLAADEGKTIKVKVSFTDDGGTAETLTSAATETVAAAATAANAIPDQTATVGLHFSYQFPTNTFTAADTGDTPTYTATKADGAALPSWLTFRGVGRVFFGTPMAGDVGTVAVKVTASDGNGGAVSDEFDIVVSAAPAARRTQALVSNIGQHPASSQGVASLDVAQGFTTGRNPRGYTLTSIEVQITTAGVIDSAVVRKTDPNTGELVATLTGPASGAGGGSNTVGTGAQTFTAPLGASLEPSTEYFVVFESDASSNGLQISYTASPDEDEGGAAGWSINNSNHWRTKASTGNFLSFPDSNQIRVNGVIKGTTASEQPGEDLPGSHSEMRTTYGLVSPGRISSGELTAAEDDVPAGSRSPSGLRGDYFRLKVQAGHSYRLQAFFKETVVGPVPLTTGGSISLAFYDIATRQRAGLSPGSDHNRDDGVTIVHLNPVWGREYYVKVNAYDHYNGDKSTTYHGEYHLVLTDITGVTLLTNNMIFRGNDGDSGGDTVTLKDETVGTTSWGMFFATGTTTSGYKIDRLQLFIEDTNSNATPVVTIRALSGEFPGDTVCTFVGLDGYASGIAPAAEDVPDTLYPDPGNCQDLDPGTSRNYWLVMEAQDTTKSYKVGALVATKTVRGPAAGWSVAGSMAKKDNSATTPAWAAVSPDQHILFRLWGTPKTSSAATAADPPAAADPPTVSGAPALSEAGSDGEWTPDETVEVTFTFSEAVTVDITGGTPTVGISLGGSAARSAAYLRGSGTTELTFGYTLTAADGSHSAMIVTHNSLALNGGTIRSQATSVDADLTHNGAAVQASPAQNSVPKGADKQPANTPATGLPTITGTAQVDETLTADTSGIADADGLTLATFAHQWIAGTADISGATGSSHTLTSGEQGRSIRVRVTFTDDAGNSEELISAATFAVALPPLTATIHDAPESHDGQTAFTFRLRLSEEFGISYRTLRDHAFTVTGGEVIKAGRLEQGSNVGWEITVEPDGDGTVTIVLPVTTDCDATGAICTSDGRVLSNSSTITVPGPASQSQPAQVENSPATGLPAITGTATVGETLSVSMSAVSDENGLTGASHSYQWVADDVNIQDATGPTHTLTAGDEGKAIRVKVSFTDDDGFAESVTSTATAAVAAKPNTPATGAPAISGTVQVGRTLTADTSAIADTDGLTLATFAHQWIAGTADISGATGSSHTLTSGDQGRSIKVRVTFTDDAGNSEELISAATFAVAPPPLTATIHDAPDSHDGQSAFTFELRLSEEFGLSYRTLRDHAFTVTGGEVVKARRLEKGKNVRWEIHVRPDSANDVTIVLPATTDCASDGAICTSDGRVLSNRLEVTVSGP